MHVTPFDKLANNELIVHPSYTRIPVHLLLGYCIRSPIDRVATTQLKVSIFVCQMLELGNVHAIEKSRDSSPIEMVNLKSNRYQYRLLACLPAYLLYPAIRALANGCNHSCQECAVCPNSN